MSTPFWQYKQKSLFLREKLMKGSPTQAVKDWGRDGTDITINGVPFQNILFDDYDLSPGDLKPEDVGNPDDDPIKILREIWTNAFLPKDMSEQNKNKWLNFFENSFHQGGASYALRGRLAEIPGPLGHIMSSPNASMRYTVKDNKIIIKETVAVTTLLLNSNSKENVQKLQMEDGGPLLTATAVYSIDLSAETPEVVCLDLVINHHNEVAEKIFDTRTIWEKLVDYINSLRGKNKLSDPTPDPVPNEKPDPNEDIPPDYERKQAPNEELELDADEKKPEEPDGEEEPSGLRM